MLCPQLLCVIMFNHHIYNIYPSLHTAKYIDPGRVVICQVNVFTSCQITSGGLFHCNLLVCVLSHVSHTHTYTHTQHTYTDYTYRICREYSAHPFYRTPPCLAQLPAFTSKFMRCLPSPWVQFLSFSCSF